MRARVGAMLRDADGRLGVRARRGAAAKRTVVDFSSPNVAKEMHVGHLRSTIIGDSLANVLGFLGHDVVRLNHIGDWGTQFGMLIEHLDDEAPKALRDVWDASPDAGADAADDDAAAAAAAAAAVDIGDLVTFYKAAKARFDADDDFKTRARNAVVALQGGDARARRAWRALCALSRVEFEKIYARLQIDGLEERGESYYNARLAGVVADVDKAGLVEVSDGARCVFAADASADAPPMIVQKADGGFLYATTDLAAVQQRCAPRAPDGDAADADDARYGEGADRVLYVTDVGQSGHFSQVFDVARRAKLNGDGVELVHVPFGLVLGEDGKKFKTRSGETVRLKDLLDEAVARAGADMAARRDDDANPAAAHDAAAAREAGAGGAAESRAERAARVVGIAAVKYADLSMNRESNYRFSYGKMLSLNGNTAPYMLYAYARVRGIQRKAAANLDGGDAAAEDDDAAALARLAALDPDALALDDATEAALARKLVRLPEVLADVERTLYPHKLCEYIFDLSQAFNKFYEQCPVNNAPTDELRASRAALCAVTASVLQLSLRLLGIEVLERL